MTTRLSRVPALLVIFTLVAGTVTMARVKTKIQRDDKFDFQSLSTWAWYPDGAGKVQVLLNVNSESEPVQRQYEPVLMQSVETKLAERGYVRDSAGTPDFLMRYFVLITTGAMSQTMGQFLPQNAQYGIPLFSPQTTAVAFYPVGTLILDVAIPGVTRLIWRGTAEAKVEQERTPEKRAERLDDIIGDLLSKFPKKKKP